MSLKDDKDYLLDDGNVNFLEFASFLDPQSKAKNEDNVNIDKIKINNNNNNVNDIDADINQDFASVFDLELSSDLINAIKQETTSSE